MDKKTVVIMKRNIIFIVFCCIQYYIFAQDIETLIDIKGYYVTVFSKQEIVFGYEQQIKRQKGQSYSTPIDYNSFSIFIPVQVGNKIVCKEKMIIERILRNVKNDSIYVLPDTHNKDLLKKIKVITSDISREICILQNALRFSPYYEISSNDSSLFRCTYIEGSAKHMNIRQIEKEWQDYLLNICLIDKRNEDPEFFFILKINNYTPYIENLKLKKWLPFLD